MKIGLSLSMCVQAIADGKVDLNEVACIITNTACRTEADWDAVVEQYAKVYWARAPKMAEVILLNLRETGRIVQPRVNGQPVHSTSTIWMELRDVAPY